MNTARPSNEAYLFEVAIDGTTYSQAEGHGLERLEVEDHVELIGVARATFSLGHGSWQVFRVGQTFEVKVGDADRLLFGGFVTGVRHTRRRGQQRVTVTAMDPLCRLSGSRHTRHFEQLTDADAVRQVVGEAGVELGTVDATARTHDIITQRNESDLDFVRRMAARSGHQLRVEEGKVQFVKPQVGGSVVELGDDVVEELDWTTSAVQVPQKVVVRGWDMTNAEPVLGEATMSDVETIGGGENALSVTGEIWAGEAQLTDVYVTSQEEAQAVAKAEINRLARGFLRGRAVIEGRADVHAGARLRFTGHPEGYNADVYVVSSQHRFEAGRGYVTEVRFCSNTLPT